MNTRYSHITAGLVAMLTDGLLKAGMSVSEVRASCREPDVQELPRMHLDRCWRAAQREHGSENVRVPDQIGFVRS